MPEAETTFQFRSAGPLRGHVHLPGDKSLSHRAALFAALAEGESAIGNFQVSGVTRALLGALQTLGVPWKLDGTTLTVSGKGLSGFSVPAAPLACGNSATTIRLLAGALAAADIPCTLAGSPALSKRPMGRVVGPLLQMGVPISATDGHAPLTLARRSAPRLKAVDYTLPVASAQVKSALILAALAADGTCTFREPGPSRDHTERMLSAMGATIETPEPGIIRVAPLARALAPIETTLPGDISSAAFLLVAAAIVPGSEIRIRRVGLNPTRTGILDALRAMGADLTVEPAADSAGEPVGDIILRYAPLHATKVCGDLVVRMIDEFPAFAIAACFAAGTTEVADARELRYKETDRISVMAGQLRALGVRIDERPDGFSIVGGTLHGGTADSCGDHRLAMSLALAGLASPAPVTVRHAEICGESFPSFASILFSLGAAR